MTKTTVIALFFLQALVTSAFARDYDVELMIFERTAVSAETEELWTSGSNQILAHQEELRTLATSAVNLPLRQSVNRLKRLETELRNSGYRLLVSSHWTQPADVFHRAPVVNVSQTESGLQGFIKIYKTSLIFADLNLGLIDPSIDPMLPSYFIGEKRRLKFKEIHYFDHPRFGAIVAVWPST